jgi:putative Holliday junction resolvase
VRVLGVDLGERRIGIAVCDRGGLVASPRCTILRSGDPVADRAKVAAVVVESGAQRVVVGLPVSLDGRRGPAARSAEEEASALAKLLGPQGVDVETFDERLTTVSAERQLLEAGHRGRARRRVIDQAAATVMLQAWLDAHSSEDDA